MAVWDGAVVGLLGVGLEPWPLQTCARLSWRSQRRPVGRFSERLTTPNRASGPGWGGGGVRDMLH
jgi:hypothetical protein